MIVLIIIVLVAWWIAGLTGLIYLERRQHDVNIGNVVFCVILGMIAGPLAWLLCLLNFMDGQPDVVVFKKRRR